MSEDVLTQLCARLSAAHDEASISRAAEQLREYLHQQEFQVKPTEPTIDPGDIKTETSS